MERTPKASASKGPSETFTGEVWIEPIVPPSAGMPVNVAAVHFSPGARSAWHCHGSSGQILYVTEGEGLVQTRGEPVVAVRVGDRIATPPAEWHWHGASPDHAMTHLTITDGAATWGEHVTDDDYRRPPGAASR